VNSINFSSIKNIWSIKTNNGSFKCEFIINCTKYLSKNNIKFCHSSSFNDHEINKDIKIAVIGSRESGLQIVKGLSEKYKIDWYARSFNHIYMDFNSQRKIISTFCSFLSWLRSINTKNIDKILSSNSCLISKNKKFIDNDLLLYYINKLKDDEFLDKLGIENYKYDFTNTLRPVFINTEHINFANIKAIQIKDDSLNYLNNYDLVILATG
jgi:lysine/ornithine N-monooxygenase